MSKTPAQSDDPILQTILPMVSQVRDQLAHLPSPQVVASTVLDEFVQRFDQACAQMARDDQSAQGRWQRAFESIDLERDMGYTRTDALKFVCAMAYASTVEPEALQPLKAWREDWKTILCDMEQVPRDVLETQQRQHMSAVYTMSLW